MPIDMKLLTLLICSVLFLMLSCKIEPTEYNEQEVTFCEILQPGLLYFNLMEVSDVLNLWLSDLQPKPTTEDPIGHLNNLTSMVERLKSDCHFDASIECYACIETYPGQSEVNIMIDSSGYVLKRVVDIWTPEDRVMSVHYIHH